MSGIDPFAMKAVCGRCRYMQWHEANVTRDEAGAPTEVREPFWCALLRRDVIHGDPACYEFTITRWLRRRIRRNVEGRGEKAKLTCQILPPKSDPIDA